MPWIWHHVTISLDLHLASTGSSFLSTRLSFVVRDPCKPSLSTARIIPNDDKKNKPCNQKICKQAALYGACIAISCQEFHVMSHQDIQRHSRTGWMAVFFTLSALVLHAVIEKVLTTPSICYVRVGPNANLLGFQLQLARPKAVPCKQFMTITW